MANGTYGNIRPADISPNDCEIFMHYTPSRGVIGNTELIKLVPSEVLIKMENPNKTSGTNEIFGGLYTLKLLTKDFGEKGIYTIIIKPIEIRTTITDCGVLSAYPNVKGLVLDMSTVPSTFSSLFENGGLTGYRIEYLSTDPSATERKIRNFFRIITSNNKVEPVNSNLSNSNQKALRYRFNDNSNLTFLSVSPSSAPNVKPNAVPYIGETNQEIIITNTFFNPIMIEIEMVEHDIETLAYGILGPQTKSLEDGVYTVYNFNEEIYKQWNLYEIKDQYSGKPLFEVREERASIDFTKQFNDISNV
jgi:hypothetical protein